jgi:hypothetical protein
MGGLSAWDLWGLSSRYFLENSWNFFEKRVFIFKREILSCLLCDELSHQRGPFLVCRKIKMLFLTTDY